MLRFARNDGGVLLLLSLFAWPALADETPSPTPDPKEAASLQTFAADHPECKEWSDGCAVCTRDAGVKCSLPGIACQPEPIACRTP